MNATKSWCAEIRYPDKKSIMCGTLICDAHAAHHEILADMTSMLSHHFPDGFEITNLLPGIMVFTQEAEQ